MSNFTSFLTGQDEERGNFLETRLMDETDGTALGLFADRVGDELPAGAEFELTESGAREGVASALESQDMGWEMQLEAKDGAMSYHDNVQPGELTAAEHQETPEDAQLRVVLASRAAKVIDMRRERLAAFDSVQPVTFTDHVPENLAYDKDLELAA